MGLLAAYVRQRCRSALDVDKLKEQSDAGPFGIFVAIEPDDLDLYRQVLPANFSMPQQPVLSLVNLDYNQPNPIVRYKEGMVMLKGVGADGEEAWYVHSMAPGFFQRYTIDGGDSYIKKVRSNQP